MTNSILLTIKKMLGIAEEYHAFDIDIIININSVFLSLNQLGVGPIDPYQITGEEETWDDFQGENFIPGVQTYVYLKTRLAFDPPTNSFLVESIRKQVEELEWRMNVEVETPPSSLVSSTDDSSPVEPPEVPSIQPLAIPIRTPVSNALHKKVLSTLEARSHSKGG